LPLLKFQPSYKNTKLALLKTNAAIWFNKKNGVPLNIFVYFNEINILG